MRITAIISILALSTVAAAQHVELGERELEETREFARRDAVADAYADAYASYYKRATVLQARAGCVSLLLAQTVFINYAKTSLEI
jgi:hypothetical protein